MAKDEQLGVDRGAWSGERVGGKTFKPSGVPTLKCSTHQAARFTSSPELANQHPKLKKGDILVQRYNLLGTLFNSRIVGGLAVALVALLVTLPVAGAQGGVPAGTIETQDLFGAAANVPGARFVHVSTDANRGGDATAIDHPLTNNNPNAIVFVTQNADPGGSGGAVNSHLLGVYYNGSKWAIFNQSLATMPRGVTFNVLIPDASAGAFVHTATSGNISGNVTTIDNPLTNNNPNAVLLITQNWNPGGSGGQYNNHPIEAGYWGGRWFILNQDLANMPTNASFNVLVLSGGPDAFVHTATAGNTNAAGWSYIDSPLTNGKPNAIVFITQVAGGSINAHPIGIRYDILHRQWAVYNRDTTDVPEGAAFNVLVPTTGTDAFFHTAAAGNISGSVTFIDNPITNNNPHAIVLVTQNWNPRGLGGTTNNHPIGVLYDGSEHKWGIFNEDLAAMPQGAGFNVLIPSVDSAVFTHISRSGNVAGSTTVIDYPLTNGKAGAILFATQNFNPSGGGAKYNKHPIGTVYIISNKWTVFNEDLATMPTDVGFNVLVRSGDTTVFTHRATSANIAGNLTWIDNPLTNDDPYAFLLVTQSPNIGGGSAYNGRPIGVRYGVSEKKWAIFNEDGSNMPANADFSVMVVVRRIFLPMIVR